ncbi:transglutaminase domain-containing protein [Chryseosolibacter indicus]|uniref:Transglutaminase-like domain-containing protein n=1 Tax=Chryseosolibacter indicus TaxID=2782351 RepID=A0ABS5VYN7_9BACT|nr:transglutaminase domain-containing protein [Chryseosolibacter indicus]MBT1706513.1 hypothetical protein [Chryseosolibacter indicus]
MINNAAALLLLISSLIIKEAQAQVSDFTNINFTKADSIAALYPEHSLYDLRGLSIKLTTPLGTEVEKFRSIYKWVCDNIENDYELYVLSTRQRAKLKSVDELRNWNRTFGAKVYRQLLRNQKTVCSGYAALIKSLAEYAGLKCLVINGYGRTAQANVGGSGVPNHSWNAVELNNKWYLCDATWSSGVIHMEERKFVKDFNQGYFLADPALFIRNHYPLDTSWILMHSKPTLNEFLNAPLVYREFFKCDIKSLIPATFNIVANKGIPLTIQLTTHKDVVIEKLQLQIGKTRPLDMALYQVKNNEEEKVYCIEYAFTSKGTHVLHVLLNGDYAVTYSVKVY